MSSLSPSLVSIIVDYTTYSSLDDVIDIFDKFSLTYEIVFVNYFSMEKVFDYTRKASSNGKKVILCKTVVPISTQLSSMTFLPVFNLSTFSDTPTGIPVGCIGVYNYKNVALFVVRMLAVDDSGLTQKLSHYTEYLQNDGNKFKVMEKDNSLSTETDFFDGFEYA